MVIETSENYIREMITPRQQNAHKGNCGRVLLVCGSVGMAGAAIMSAKAALKSGAGLVTICAPGDLFPILQTAVPEAMCIERDSIIYDNIDINQFDCIGAGPGLRVGREQYQLIEHLLVSYRGPLVLDADGLNCLCRYARVPENQTYMGEAASAETDEMEIPRKMTALLPEITARRKFPVILTPHPGEADRLLEYLGQPKSRELGREKTAETLASKSGAIVVLKGPGTLVAQAAASGGESSVGGSGDGVSGDRAPGVEASAGVDIFRNPTGNPGMATGGSGDVLTGVITALVAYGRAQVKQGMAEGVAVNSAGSDSGESVIAAGLTPLDAARAAVYMHGLAGDIAASRQGEIGMTAMDIIEALPKAFLNIAGW